MTARIAIAGIEHETNTYCQDFTTADQFYVQRGAKMLRSAGQQTQLGGAIDACQQLDLEPVPVLHAHAQPSGIVDFQSYDNLKQEILSELQAIDNLSGVMLLLHGAGVVDGIPDLEADLVTAVRELVGAEIPIAAAFDLHGNISQAMTQHLNGVFACHQYPHIDQHLRAAEGIRLLQAIINGQPKPHCVVVQLPMLLPTTTTFVGIGETMLAKVLAAERHHKVIDISWFHGFPYADVAHIGSSICVTGYGPDLTGIANEVAQQLWQAREQFRVESLDGAAAVAEAQRLNTNNLNGPVVIHETSDNCGGGTPGDGTHLLRAMLDAGLGAAACFGFIVDPEVAAQAHKAGVGADITVALGGKTDELHGAPIATQAHVKALADGKLILQHMGKGAPLHLGPLARLVIDGIDVIVGSRRSQTFDREPFLAVGVVVERYRYVALKSSNHFRAGFQELAGAIVTADTPGLTTHQLEVFPRQHTNQRLWPLHDDASFAAR